MALATIARKLNGMTMSNTPPKFRARSTEREIRKIREVMV
jgi:hypothetical protein